MIEKLEPKRVGGGGRIPARTVDVWLSGMNHSYYVHYCYTPLVSVLSGWTPMSIRCHAHLGIGMDRLLFFFFFFSFPVVIPKS